jgi:hypothetical protein
MEYEFSLTDKEIKGQNQHILSLQGKINDFLSQESAANILVSYNKSSILSVGLKIHWIQPTLM